MHDNTIVYPNAVSLPTAGDLYYGIGCYNTLASKAAYANQRVYRSAFCPGWKRYCGSYGIPQLSDSCKINDTCDLNLDLVSMKYLYGFNCSNWAICCNKGYF